MKNSKWLPSSIVMGILFCLLLIPISSGAEEGSPQGVMRIAVMPFFRGEEPANVEAVLSCSLDQFCPEQVDVAPGGEKVVTDISWKEISRRYDELIVPQKEAWDVFGGMQAFGSDDTPRALALRFGQTLEASHVVLGNVWRYREKVIEKEKLASVAFSMYLLDVATGRRIWRERYDKSQQPLSENLLKVGDFISQGGRLLTAKELAGVGVKEMMKKFPTPEAIVRRSAADKKPQE
jgi:hypothetical protein